MSKYIRNKHNYIKPKNFILATFFFLVISVLFFRGIIFSKGLVVSSDWMIPLSFKQMEKYIESQFYTWNPDMNLFGLKKPIFVAFPFVLLMKIFLILGLNGEILSKALLVGVFALSGISMFLLLRFLGLKKISALVGGFIFITMPVFFDYAIMGWCFVLFAVGTVLPITVICFIKSVEERKIIYSVISGLLFSIAMLQSQSVIWFPMVFIALSFYLVRNRETFFSYAKSILIIILLVMAFHSTWWPNIAIFKDPGVVSSDLALDTVSLGMRMRLSFINILRGWGGLFNYQYEISYPKSLLPLSFLIFLMAFVSLFLGKLKNKRDIRFPLVIIIIYMFIFYLIDPKIMARIPFSNLIRDIGRLTALTSFSYAILASFFLSSLLDSVNKKKRIIAFFFLFLIFLNSFSFISGKLYGKPQQICDTRLRTYQFPEDYYLAENYLYQIKRDVKSYYPPSGTNIAIKDRPEFNKDYADIKDPFRGFSPLPGTIYMYYSGLGKPPEMSFILDSLFNENNFEKSLRLMGIMNIEDIIIRDDILYPKTQLASIINLLSNSEDKNLLNFGKVQIIKNEYLLPHFYIPNYIVFSPNEIKTLLDIFSFGDYPLRTGVYLGKEKAEIGKSDLQPNEIFVEGKLTTPSTYEVDIPRSGEYTLYTSGNPSVSLPIDNDFVNKGKVNLNEGKQSIQLSFDKTPDLIGLEKWEPKIILRNIQTPEIKKIPKISFIKINATKYKVKVEEAREPYTLIFSESFHQGWKAYVQTSNINSQDYGAEVASYFNGDIKEGVHKNIFLNRDTFETWGKKPLSEDKHLIVNGYANSWYITPEDVGGKQNYELIIEFLPQRNFYVGFAVLIITLIGCLVYLSFNFIKKIKLKKENT